MTQISTLERQPDEPAQLTNMKLALAAMLDIQDAGDGSPRLGLFYGPSGYGKSVAAAYCAARLDAGYIVANSFTTKRSLLEAIATELGVVRQERTAARLFAQIVDQLIADPKALIVDEFDYLVEKGLVQIIRDIHDAARTPILMIGEEALPAKLKAWERFDNRILVATAAQPSSLADALLLRDYYCTRVMVEDDLVEAIVKATHGVTRRIVTNLEAVQTVAIAAKISSIDADAWGDRRFKTGSIPVRRAA